MNSAPWAKFRMRSTPKMSERPAEMRKSSIPFETPASVCRASTTGFCVQAKYCAINSSTR